MYCPKCSQQQIPEAARFCSRCGFHLRVVRALLTEDISQTVATAAQLPDRSLRKRDLSIGAAIMFFVAFLTSVITADLPPSDGTPIVLLIVAWLPVMLLINIGPLIRYFIHGDGSSARAKNSFPAQPAHNLLPSQNAPVSGFARQRVNTAEITQPPTVTEHTTNLLSGEYQTSHSRLKR